MMELKFALQGLTALYPGCESDDFAGEIAPKSALPKINRIPMLTARRLTWGNRMAIESALTLLEKERPQALLFSSRHSELEHNYRILKALADDTDVSPTDFTMSVHNSAIGTLAIQAKLPLPASASAAGADTFASLLMEAYALLSTDYQSVLCVDFDGAIPEFYLPHINAGSPAYPHACALLLKRGDDLHIKLESIAEPDFTKDEPTAQSLAFYRALKQGQQSFTLKGAQYQLQICCTNAGAAW